jgi:enediyne biosynthesis protein E4
VILRFTARATFAACVCVVAAACGACGGDAPSPQKPSATAPAGPVPPSGPRFTDVSAGSGLTLVNVNGDPASKPTILESLGQGAAALDYDGDGDLDLFVCNGDVLHGRPAGANPRCALYRQDAPFRFTDATDAAGVALRGWYQGAYAADVESDGDPDLFLTAWGATRLLVNRGDGTFEDATVARGAGVAGWTSGAVFFDADQDGDLDLYVARYVTMDPEKPPHDGKPCNWKGLAVACGPHGLPAEADVFLENVGDRFVDATAKFGFDRATPSYGLGAVAFDFDRDGDQDVYVANDSVANFLWENRRGSFVESAAELGCDLGEGGRAQAGMGVDAADADGDGRPDVVVTNFDEDVNTLYLNQCDAKVRAFFNATAAAGLGPPSFRKLAWGARFFDADGDGRLDLAIANGHIYPQVDRAGVDTSFAQENQLFLNQGADARGLVRFVAAADAGSFFAKKACSRGLLTADFDDDLDLDLLVVEMDAPPTLGRNDTAAAGGRLGVRLRGAGKNRDAIGATLTWEDERGTTRFLERTYGGGFYSTSDPRLVATWGPGALRAARVRFPAGRTVEIDPALVGRYVVVDEAAGTAVPEPKGAR